MKTVFNTVIAFALLLASCQKLDLVHSHFADSSCSTEQCDCEEGFAGDFCDIALTPKTVIIHSVEINAIPAFNHGESWDEYIGLPDVSFSLSHMHEVLYESQQTYQDAQPDDCLKFTNVEVPLTDVLGEYRIRLIDEDPGSKSSEIIEDLYFKPYIKEDGLPETIHIKEDGTEATLHLSYRF
ncbi:MAG: hypothetical protein HQ500_05750 [Flavobacteriales bacterium]|nr:hypothetical protein [Flavobacteriales bacterium]